MRKISQTRINRAFNKRVVQNDMNPIIEITEDNSTNIYPFELTMGFVNATENGQVQDNVDINDYSSFQRVFTGLENIIARWENSTSAYKAKDNDTFLTKEFKVGRSIKGLVLSEDMAAQFKGTAVSEDFLAEFTEESFQVILYEDLQEVDLFKFYIIPTKKAEK